MILYKKKQFSRGYFFNIFFGKLLYFLKKGSIIAWLNEIKFS